MRRAIWISLMTLAVACAAGSAPQPTLAIARATLHESREDGPPLRAGYQYIPGEMLFLSFRATGYTVKNNAVDLRWQTYITDPTGVMIAPIEQGAVKDEVTDNDKDWLPQARQSVPLPPDLIAGQYTIHLRLADENAQATAEQTLSFQVRGHALEKLDRLVVRALRFYRDDNDTQPIEPAVYQPGDMLWLRCEVAGYRLGQDNAYEVAYGFSIYGQPDKLLYEQKDAGADHGAPFYPRRWLSAIFNVSLSRDLAPGQYRIVIVARDKLSGATAEQGSSFTVRP
jgi:hypothetical protein